MSIYLYLHHHLSLALTPKLLKLPPTCLSASNLPPVPPIYRSSHQSFTSHLSDTFEVFIMLFSAYNTWMCFLHIKNKSTKTGPVSTSEILPTFCHLISHHPSLTLHSALDPRKYSNIYSPFYQSHIYSSLSVLTA